MQDSLPWTIHHSAPASTCQHAGALSSVVTAPMKTASLPCSTRVAYLPQPLLLSPAGSASEGSTQSKACSSHAASTNLLARSWHVDWKYTAHCWAVADTRLARALLGYPLTLTVHRQEPSKPGSQGGSTQGASQGSGQQQQQQWGVQALGLVVQGKGQGGTAAAAAAVVPVGSVEVDLAALLATRPGSSAPTCR